MRLASRPLGLTTLSRPVAWQPLTTGSVCLLFFPIYAARIAEDKLRKSVEEKQWQALRSEARAQEEQLVCASTARARVRGHILGHARNNM